VTFGVLGVLDSILEHLEHRIKRRAGESVALPAWARSQTGSRANPLALVY